MGRTLRGLLIAGSFLPGLDISSASGQVPDGIMQNPWSGYPGYTSVQVQDFNRAKEQAVITKLSYDFTRLGLEGVSAYALFVHGWNRVNPSTKAGVPNENEFDTDIQWRPKWSFLNGFSARFRYARVNQYQGPKDHQDDFRLIINYDFPLL